MLLTTSDKHAAREVTLFYCISTCVLMPIIIYVIFHTDYYLLLGKTKSLPLFAIFVAFEIVKWWFHRFSYDKSGKYPSHRRSTTAAILSKYFNAQEFYRSALLTILACFIFFVMAILFGAEVFEHHEETLMFSILLTILTIFPFFLNLGRSAVMELLFGRKPTNTFHWLLYKNFVATIMGSWLGACLIPLDWDRPWQVWPVSCSFGALVGYTASHLITLTDYNPYGIKKRRR